MVLLPEALLGDRAEDLHVFNVKLALEVKRELLPRSCIIEETSKNKTLR